MRIGEIAEFLSVTRERVRQLVQRDLTFPQPVETKPHRRWDRVDVEQWVDAYWWETRPWRRRRANQPMGR